MRVIPQRDLRCSIKFNYNLSTDSFWVLGLFCQEYWTVCSYQYEFYKNITKNYNLSIDSFWVVGLFCQEFWTVCSCQYEFHKYLQKKLFLLNWKGSFQKHFLHFPHRANVPCYLSKFTDGKNKGNNHVTATFYCENSKMEPLVNPSLVLFRQVRGQQTRFTFAINATKGFFARSFFLKSQILRTAGKLYYKTSDEENHFKWEHGAFKALLVLPNLNIPKIVLYFKKWSLLQIYKNTFLNSRGNLYERIKGYMQLGWQKA